MNQLPASAAPHAPRRPLITSAATLYALAAVIGIPGIVMLFNKTYANMLVQDLISGGITDASSLLTWQVINTAVTLLICIGPCLMATGFLKMALSRPILGVNFLGSLAQVLLRAVTVSGAATMALAGFRIIRYTAICIRSPGGLMMFYSMCISEALMISQAVFLFFLIRRFLNCCIDSCASIGYSLATGKLDTRSIPGFTATGFLILALFGLGIALNRLFTVTIVGSHYALITATHPALIAQVLCLFFGSTANVLLFFYLKSYKRSTEQALFDTHFLKKRPPV